MMQLRIRNLLVSAAAGAMATAAGADVALAADMPNYEPPPAQAYSPAPAWSWTGPYAGLTGGYGWGGGDTGAGSYSTNGWGGGGFIGYNLQTNQNLVVGLEGDVTFWNKSGSDGATLSTSVKNPWNGTLRGRVGYAWDRFMLYGTAGVAVGGLKSTGDIPDSATKVGWTAGAGIEAALTDKVTGRVEYRHTDLGEFPGGGSSYTSDDIMVGVGFKF